MPQVWACSLHKLGPLATSSGVGRPTALAPSPAIIVASAHSARALRGVGLAEEVCKGSQEPTQNLKGRLGIIH